MHRSPDPVAHKKTVAACWKVHDVTDRPCIHSLLDRNSPMNGVRDGVDVQSSLLFQVNVNMVEFTVTADILQYSQLPQEYQIVALLHSYDYLRPAASSQSAARVNRLACYSRDYHQHNFESHISADKDPPFLCPTKSRYPRWSGFGLMT